jgi:hypothetical protein
VCVCGCVRVCVNAKPHTLGQVLRVCIPEAEQMRARIAKCEVLNP